MVDNIWPSTTKTHLQRSEFWSAAKCRTPSVATTAARYLSGIQPRSGPWRLFQNNVCLYAHLRHINRKWFIYKKVNKSININVNIWKHMKFRHPPMRSTSPVLVLICRIRFAHLTAAVAAANGGQRRLLISPPSFGPWLTIQIAIGAEHSIHPLPWHFPDFLGTSIWILIQMIHQESQEDLRKNES